MKCFLSFLWSLLASMKWKKKRLFLNQLNTKDFFPTEGYSVKPSNILTSHFQARRWINYACNGHEMNEWVSMMLEMFSTGYVVKKEEERKERRGKSEKCWNTNTIPYCTITDTGISYHSLKYAYHLGPDLGAFMMIIKS